MFQLLILSCTAVLGLAQIGSQPPRFDDRGFPIRDYGDDVNFGPGFGPGGFGVPEPGNINLAEEAIARARLTAQGLPGPRGPLAPPAGFSGVLRGPEDLTLRNPTPESLQVLRNRVPVPRGPFVNPNYEHIPILEDVKEGPYPDGSYSFRYQTGNGIFRQEQQVPTGPNTVEVTGSYSYTSPEGIPVEVQYVADEYGFRTVNPGLPTTNILENQGFFSPDNPANRRLPAKK